jgi:O-antigen/teichoic acid export membrane protein
MSTQTKKITLDTAAIFLGKVVGLIFGMARLSYLATYLGLANFGILNFALYFCSLFQVLFDFGMSQLLTRDIARDLSKSTELVGRIIILKIIIVFIAGAVVGLIGIALHFDNQTNWAILLTTVVFAINGISMIFLSAFQAHRKMTIVSVSNILNDLLLSIFVVLLIKESPYVITVLILSIIVALANMIFLYLKYTRTVGVPEYCIDKKLWTSFLKDSAPIAMNSLGISMYMFIGPTVLKYSRGDIEVGIYTAGYKLVSILMLIPMAYSQVVYPIFSEFYNNAKEKLSKALLDSVRLMSLVVIPIIVGVLLLANKIFDFLYTSEFKFGVIVLQLSIIGCLWSFLNAITSTFLLAINRQLFLMILSITLGVLMSIISILLLPHTGYISIPILLVATEVIIFTFHRWYLSKNGYKQFSLIFFVKPFIASFIMGLVMWFCLSFNIFAIIFLGVTVYLILMVIMKGFGEQEKEIFQKIIQRISNGKPKAI